MNKETVMPPRIQRHEKIIALVREHGFMPIDTLARELDVTPQTIRRDINLLCEENILRRYHGGAALGESLRYAARRRQTWRSVQTVSSIPWS